MSGYKLAEGRNLSENYLEKKAMPMLTMAKKKEKKPCRPWGR